MISRKRGALAAEQIVDKDLAVEIGLGKAVAAVVELGVVPALVEAERVEIGFEMAAHPVGADQLQGADRVRRRPAQRLGIDSLPRRAVADDRRAMPQAGPRSSASTAEPSSSNSAKNRRQLSSTELGSSRKRV